LATVDAIAGLGDTLLLMLQEGLGGLVTPANVLLSTPSEFKSFAPNRPAVTVFLYHVAINGEMRNVRRSSTGEPLLPLELRFLVTPWTQLARDSYRIVGAIAQLFNDRAVLGFGELVGDGIWAPEDTVELILESLPVEQHYDIWDPTDIPYRLSLTYLARVIGIDSTTFASGPPVALATFPKVMP
jgi:hypothetical protein